MQKTIRIETDVRGVATLYLDRTEKHNALSKQMIKELTDTAEILGNDDNVRVVILTGAGKSFCAGGDLGWMQEQMQSDNDARRSEARKLAMMLHALNEMPKPLIGRVQGNAFGGGVGMMSVCDTVIAADHTRFALTETKLGLIPATIGPYVIARLGEANARRVFMSGRLFDAAEAVQLGLVARIAHVDDLDAAIEAEVAPYLDCAPGAVAAAKVLARQLGPKINEGIIDATVESLISRWQDSEATEGISAFFEKRKPNWKL